MMLESMDHWQLRAALEWQAELGVDEACLEAPVNRYDMPAKPAAPAKPAVQAVPVQEEVGPDPVAEAKSAASRAPDLAALEAAMGAFEHCELKRGARNLVFSDGNADARLMVIGEAPGRDEDRAGRPFVGAAGQLLDKMLGAIDMARDATDAQQSVYITNILPWRPPRTRGPLPEELDMMRPFVQRHIELIAPDVIILMGNAACRMLLGKHSVARLRGKWTQTCDIPTMPMLHPEELISTPAAKREAWHDLLEIQAKLRS